MDVVPVGQSVALQVRGLIPQQVIDVNTTVSCSELAGGPGGPPPRQRGGGLAARFCERLM